MFLLFRSVDSPHVDLLARPVRSFRSKERTCELTLSALITGASSGIGASTALLFAKAGCNLVLLARRADRLEEVKARCEAANQKGKVVVVETDVTKRGDLDGVLGKLDGLKVDM